jgi:hypothetical protein
MISIPHRLSVVKRDGRKVSFDLSRIVRAVSLATFEAESGSVNPFRNSSDDRFGLESESFNRVLGFAKQVETDLVNRFGSRGAPHVEDIQDAIELSLISTGQYKVVHLYISHRVRHAELRPVAHGEIGMQEYIAISRYCRF